MVVEGSRAERRMGRHHYSYQRYHLPKKQRVVRGQNQDKKDNLTAQTAVSGRHYRSSKPRGSGQKATSECIVGNRRGSPRAGFEKSKARKIAALRGEGDH